LEAFLAGREYDKSQLATLSCETLKQTFPEQVVASSATAQIIQEGSWSVASQCSLFYKLTSVTQVGSMLVDPLLHYYPRDCTECF
jgi:hypothetical protein